MGAVTKRKAKGSQSTGTRAPRKGTAKTGAVGKAPVKTPAKTKATAQTANMAKRSAPQPPIDPETDPDLLEFLRAVDHYKLERSRPFPSYSELLTILRNLGWRRSAH